MRNFPGHLSCPMFWTLDALAPPVEAIRGQAVFVQSAQFGTYGPRSAARLAQDLAVGRQRRGSSQFNEAGVPGPPGQCSHRSGRPDTQLRFPVTERKSTKWRQTLEAGLSP